MKDEKTCHGKIFVLHDTYTQEFILKRKGEKCSEKLFVVNVLILKSWRGKVELVWQSFHSEINWISSKFSSPLSWRPSSTENLIMWAIHQLPKTLFSYENESLEWKSFRLHLLSQPPLGFVESHKSQATSPKHQRQSYLDEQSPRATTGHNSINVSTQFNSTSASNFIDCRRFDLPYNKLILLWHNWRCQQRRHYFRRGS